MYCTFTFFKYFNRIHTNIFFQIITNKINFTF